MEQGEKRQTRPAPKGLGGLLRNIGPGVIVSGSVVGSGELLVTTHMGAKVGFVFLWGVIFACLAKFFIQLELGRQCLLHNSTTIEILDRVPGWRLGRTSWLSWVCVIGYFMVTIAVIGILGSVAGLLGAVWPAVPQAAWAGLAFVMMAALLYRGLYEDMEKMVTVLVGTFSFVVIFSVLMLQGTSYAIDSAQLLSGFQFELPTAGALVAISVMGSVGVTAVELFMYPYWIREKGYPDFVGPKDDSPEWQERYRGWMRVLFADASVCTLIALVITCAYYLLGASVLNELNVLPEGIAVAQHVSLIFTETIGQWAYSLFMFGAFCTLFSTLLVFASSSGRIGADFLRQVGMDSLGQGDKHRRMERILQTVFPFCWLLFIWIEPGGLDFVLQGARVNNYLLIPMAYGILHLAMRTRGDERMPLSIELGLLFTIWLIINFTAISLYQAG
jgi:manganese transport protein